MADPLRKADRRYTYGDYKTWPDDERWELIDGVAWNMSPAPSRAHQRISMRFLMQITPCINEKDCEVYHAPFDVLLPDSILSISQNFFIISVKSLAEVLFNFSSVMCSLALS